jgi:hypothetical protein
MSLTESVADGTTDTQSYGIVIRDTLYAKLVTLPFFSGFFSRRAKQFQVVPEVLPYLGVYFISESMTADGDPNAGEVRFNNDMSIGFSVVIQNNDPVRSELMLDEAYWAIMNGLWRDQYIMNMLDTRASAPADAIKLPDGMVIEGVRGGSRKHVWGNSGLNNEMPIAELSYVANILYSSAFPPIITDDLLRIHMEAVPLARDGTIPPVDVVQRIIMEYEFTPAVVKAA